MKILLTAFLALSLSLAAGCNGASDDGRNPDAGTSDGTNAAANSDAHRSQPTSGGMQGRVTETMDSGGYTYVALDVDGKQVWAAGPQTKVAVGDTVWIPSGMEMKPFHSDTLDRTFDSILFVNAIRVGGAPSASSPHGGAAPHGGSPTAADAKVSGVEPLEGGKTVEEIVKNRADLAGKTVAVRGKVVKYNGGILGKNWLHIQDGSGAAADGTNDLAVTTDAQVSVGDVVVVRGPVSVDKDFGAGYAYEVIVENAEVTKE